MNREEERILDRAYAESVIRFSMASFAIALLMFSAGV